MSLLFLASSEKVVKEIITAATQKGINICLWTEFYTPVYSSFPGGSPMY